MRYVLCPTKITSPAPPEGSPFRPNVVCSQRCKVVRVGEWMHFRCPSGHEFHAHESEIRDDHNPKEGD